MSAVRNEPMLERTSELSWLALTTDQARILQQVVDRNRAEIREQWSFGIYDGLREALTDIEWAGGAYIRKLPSPYLAPSCSSE